MPVRVLLAVALAEVLGLTAAGCERAAPQGAEAAAHAADQPKPGPVAITPQASPQPSAQDFVTQASAGDAFEIAAAQIAQSRAQNPEVKDLARMIAHDHAASSGKLKAALDEAGQSLAAANAPNPDQQAQLGRLRQEAPKGFDKAYLAGQVAAHQKALALMQGYAQDGGVTALKAFAGEGASLVQRHLDLAQSLDERLE